MVQINKVYTRGGDKGQTSLAGGGRIAKNHPRVEAYGTVDELNSIIGICQCHNLLKPESPQRDQLEKILQGIQQKLFDLGSELATSPDKANKKGPSITEKNIQWLEDVIDVLNADLPALTSFVLPGGGPVTAFLHQARTVCRRAERRTLDLSQQETVGESKPGGEIRTKTKKLGATKTSSPQPVGWWVVPYLNRLSDCLFVLARWSSKNLSEPEFLWEPGKEDDSDWKTG